MLLMLAAPKGSNTTTACCSSALPGHVPHAGLPAKGPETSTTACLAEQVLARQPTETAWCSLKEAESGGAPLLLGMWASNLIHIIKMQYSKPADQQRKP